MKSYFYHAVGGNFGDDLNGWFWDEVLPGWQNLYPDTHLLIGVGTLINELVPQGPTKLVMGSGVGYGTKLPSQEVMDETHFVAVRGPRSASTLGLPPSVGVVDPAVLISDLPRFRDIPVSGKPIFVPHISSMGSFDWSSLCAQAGLDFVAPTGPADEVIARIAAAPLVIAESMHAAILADAFGRPWHGWAMSLEFNDFKWLDWADSLDIKLVVHRAPWVRNRPKTNALGGLSRGVRPPEARERALTVRERLKVLNHALRRSIKHRILVRQFRQLQSLPGQISDRAVLSDRKAELRRRYDQVATGDLPPAGIRPQA